MALFPKLAAKPHKGLSTCYGQLGCNGTPSRGGHRWVEPCPTIFPKSHFVTAGRGPGRGGWPRARRGDTERGHKRARTQGNANSSMGVLWEQRSPRRAGSASLLSLFPAPAQRWPRSRRGPSALRPQSQWQHNGPVGQGQAWFSPSPPSTSPFHLHHHLQERSGRRWLRGTTGGGGGGKYRSLA